MIISQTQLKIEGDQLLRRLGGSLGVTVTKEEREGILVIVKEYNLVEGGARYYEHLRETFERERSIYGDKGCPFIPELLEVSYPKTKSGQDMTYRPRLVTQYIEGETLDQKLREEVELDEETLEKIAYSVLGALKHIHFKGALHKEVTPKNIMLSSDGRVYLLDLDGDDYEVSGDIAYLHEVAIGGDFSQEADYYSLGRSLYAALLGRHLEPDEVMNEEFFNNFLPLWLPIIKGLSSESLDSTSQRDSGRTVDQILMQYREERERKKRQVLLDNHPLRNDLDEVAYKIYTERIGYAGTSHTSAGSSPSIEDILVEKLKGIETEFIRLGSVDQEKLNDLYFDSIKDVPNSGFIDRLRLMGDPTPTTIERMSQRVARGYIIRIGWWRKPDGYKNYSGANVIKKLKEIVEE